MKRILLAAVLSAATLPAFAGVGVSVNIGEPGFFGQIDIGDAPAPEFVNPQPVLVEQGVVGGAPLYLHVPPGHIKHWRKHCAAYNACGRPVYFVSDRWYNERYVPYYRQGHERHEGHEDHHGDHAHGHD